MANSLVTLRGPLETWVRQVGRYIQWNLALGRGAWSLIGNEKYTVFLKRMDYVRMKGNGVCRLLCGTSEDRKIVSVLC